LGSFVCRFSTLLIINNVPTCFCVPLPPASAVEISEGPTTVGLLLRKNKTKLTTQKHMDASFVSPALKARQAGQGSNQVAIHIALPTS